MARWIKIIVHTLTIALVCFALIMVLNSEKSTELPSESISFESISVDYSPQSNIATITTRICNHYPSRITSVHINAEILDKDGSTLDYSFSEYYNGILEVGDEHSFVMSYEGIPYAVKITGVSFHDQNGVYVAFSCYDEHYFLYYALPEYEQLVKGQSSSNSEEAQIANTELSVETIPSPEEMLAEINGTSGTESPVETFPFLVGYSPANIVSAGNYHTAFIRNDNTVGAVGRSSDSRCDVSEWEDIVLISASSHTVGVDSTGRVYATGVNGYGQCNVSGWSGIIDIDTSENNTIGLSYNGKVIVAGDNEYGQCDVSNWNDIVDVTIGALTSYGLKTNGTVVAAGSNASGQKNIGAWSNITAICAGRNHIVGLREDGTVVATGNNANGQCDVSTWTDIVAISAGPNHTVALKADGTVVAAGSNGRGQCDVGSWSNIISISAGATHTVGMHSDGSLVAVGNNGYGQCDVGG